MNVSAIVFLACLAPLTSIAASPDKAATYYVDAVNGNDGNAGTSAAQAFKTLSKAQTSVRSINGDMKEDIVVCLRGGTHSLTSTIVMSEKDSGTNGHDIIYKAYPGESPVISGGKNLAGGWSLHDRDKNIYKRAEVPGSFRQLFVNGSPRVRARYPNLEDAATGGPYLKALNSKAPFKINAKEIGAWAKSGACEFVWLSHWSQYRCRIADYTTKGSSATVLFKSPEDQFDMNHHAQTGGYHYFENAYELLDAEGEWFLDEASHVLYYKPKSGEDMSTVEVIAPAVQRLITIAGNDAPAHNIQFHDITFAHDNWTDVNAYGYVSMQGGQVIQTVKGAVETDTVVHRFSPTSGMVCLRNANNIRIERNTFTLGGSWGIMELDKCDHNTYTGNYFNKLASGAIAIGNTSVPCTWYTLPVGQSSYDVISNNLVDGVSCYYLDAVGILALKVKQVTIKNNEVRNLPYSGISVGFEWEDNGNQDSHDNTVSHNRIHNVMTLLDDGGAIYALGKNVNGSITKNYSYNLLSSQYSGGSSNASYYLDRGSCFWTIDHNVSDFAGVATFVKNTPNHDNIGRYLYYNGPFGDGISGYSVLADNPNCTGKKWPLEAIDIMKQARIEAPFGNIGDITFGANVAVSGTASASSTLDTNSAPSRGNDNDCAKGAWASDKSEANPFWQVDLGSPCKISEVDIVALQGDGISGSQANIEIWASNTPDFKEHVRLDNVESITTPSERRIYIKTVNHKNAFRYVRLQRTGSAGHFGFAECRVFGEPGPSAGAIGNPSLMP